MLFPVRGGPSSSPGEPQAAACSTSRGALRVMTKCNRIKIQKSNILLQPGTTVSCFFEKSLFPSILYHSLPNGVYLVATGWIFDISLQQSLHKKRADYHLFAGSTPLSFCTVGKCTLHTKWLRNICAYLICLNITQRQNFPWLAGWRIKNAKRVK